MRLINSKNKIYITTFLFIFLSSSFIITNNVVSNAFTIILWVGTLACSFQRTIIVNKSTTFIVTLLLFLMWISYLSNNDDVLRAAKSSFVFLFAFVFVSQYNINEFSTAYRTVMYYLCVISLVLFALFSIVPDLSNLFLAQTSSGRSYSNLIIFVHRIGIDRNCGLFWEPGAFQTFITIAALLEIYSEQRIRNIVIFIITIITTFSTTGYFACALLLVLILINNKLSAKKRVFFLIAFSSYFFATDSSSVFGKIINFINNQQYSDDQVVRSSAVVRFFSITKPFEAFLQSPLVGMCHSNLTKFTRDYTFGMNTCTFINWFAMYGFLYGAIMLVGLILFAKRLSHSNFSFIVCLLIILIAISSENFADNCMILILCLFGLNERNTSYKRLETAL